MIGNLHQVVGIDWLAEGRPAAAGVILACGGEQRLAADYVHVNPRVECLVVFVGEGLLSIRFLGDGELQGTEGIDAVDEFLPGGDVRDFGRADMAIAAQILFQIILVIVLGGVEILQRFHFDDGRASKIFRHLSHDLAESLFLLAGPRARRVEIKAGAVLATLVVSLSIEGEGVDDIEIEPGHGGQGHTGRVENHFNRFHRVGGPGTDLLIGRVGHLGLGVTDLGGQDPVDPSQVFLHPPETASSYVDGLPACLVLGLIGHDAPFRSFPQHSEAEGIRKASLGGVSRQAYLWTQKGEGACSGRSKTPADGCISALAKMEVLNQIGWSG